MTQKFVQEDWVEARKARARAKKGPLGPTPATVEQHNILQSLDWSVVSAIPNEMHLLDEFDIDMTTFRKQTLRIFRDRPLYFLRIVSIIIVLLHDRSSY